MPDFIIRAEETDLFKGRKERRMNCLECKEYNHETHDCPKFCDVIRETVKDIRKDSIPIDWIESQVDKGKWAELVQRWAERKVQ